MPTLFHAARPASGAARPCAQFVRIRTIIRAGVLSLAPAFALVPAASAATFHSPFTACARDCAVSVFGGRQVTTAMADIYLKGDVLPSNWRYGKSYFAGAAVSRPLVTFGEAAQIDGEFGAGRRFGAMKEGEAWGALYVRWKQFPWNDRVRTSVAISTGLNLASRVDPYERAIAEGGGSKVLHYLAPEVTFGPPSRPDLDLFLRFHHRSGGKLAAFNHTGGGAQFSTVGVRYRW